MNRDARVDGGGEADLDWAAVDPSNCSIGHAAALVGDRWALLVLRELTFGLDRFDALQCHLNVSRRTLADRLVRLVAAGLVERVPYETAGERVRHRYVLTEAGAELGPVIAALREWGDKHRPDDPPVRMVHTGCGHDARLHLRCTAGHDVPWTDAHGEPGPGARPFSPGTASTGAGG